MLPRRPLSWRQSIDVPTQRSQVLRPLSDIDAYRHFLDTILLKLPDVEESTSCTVMELVKETLNLPMLG